MVAFFTFGKWAKYYYTEINKLEKFDDYLFYYGDDNSWPYQNTHWLTMVFYDSYLWNDQVSQNTF